MSVVFDRLSPSGWRSLVASAFILGAALSPAFAQNEGLSTVTVSIDQAQLMKLPEGVATLIVGNPLIADVSIQAGGMVVLTAKGYGATNLVALDRSGNVLQEKRILVQGARDAVTVFRGTERESYSCTPKCERRITLGDSPDYFAATISQATQRSGLAQGGAPQSK